MCVTAGYNKQGVILMPTVLLLLKNVNVVLHTSDSVTTYFNIL